MFECKHFSFKWPAKIRSGQLSRYKNFRVYRYTVWTTKKSKIRFWKNTPFFLISQQIQRIWKFHLEELALFGLNKQVWSFLTTNNRYYFCMITFPIQWRVKNNSKKRCTFPNLKNQKYIDTALNKICKIFCLFFCS